MHDIRLVSQVNAGVGLVCHIVYSGWSCMSEMACSRYAISYKGVGYDREPMWKSDTVK